MPKLISFRSCLWLVLLFAGCVPAAAQHPSHPPRHEFREVHMGMPVRLVLYARSDSLARVAARAAFDRIAELDRDLSDYQGESELRRIEHGAGSWVRIKPTTYAVLERALDFARLSDGAFDPTVGPLVALWRDARLNKILPSAEAISSARALVSYQYLELDSSRSSARLARPRMKLDLGAIAKGFILDQAMRTLRDRAPAALLEAGGDIVVGLAPAGQRWRIEVPGADSSFARQAATLQHSALSTSGPSAQFVEIGGVRYSHVIDPRTGYGLTHSLTAHVIARDAATADAIATILTLLTPEARAGFVAKFAGVKAYTVR